MQRSIDENQVHAIQRSMQPVGSLPDLDALNREAMKALIVSQQDQLRVKEEQLQSRVKALRSYVMKSEKLHADDTPVERASWSSSIIQLTVVD